MAGVQPRIPPLTDPSPEVAELLDKTRTGQGLSGRWSQAELLAGFYGMVSGLLNVVRVQREPDTPGWPD